MLSDLVFWLGDSPVELALTAGIVVTASVVTERAGPLIGALVMTLPVTCGPPIFSSHWITTKLSLQKARSEGLPSTP